MKNKKYILFALPLLLLGACASSNIASDNQNNDSNSDVGDIKDDGDPTGDSSEGNEGSSNNEDSSEKEWNDGLSLLDCGYYQAALPENKNNPYELKTTLSGDSSSWSNNDMKEYMPSNFKYVYKNAWQNGPTNHRASPTFYSSDSGKPGGLKIANTGVGFQSMMFNHTGAKLEIRLGISQVNNANDTPAKGKDTAYFYFFRNDGSLVGKYTVSENTITTNTNEIKFYYTDNAEQVSYFEFRINEKPYKGGQAYNIGIGYCNIKSWERA